MVSPPSFALDIAPFQESAKSYCQKEPNSKLMQSCLLEAGRNIGKFQVLVSRNENTEIFKFCSESSKMDSEFALYSLLKCSLVVSEKKKLHPFPRWVGVDLIVGKFRAEWVSNCFSRYGQDVNDCVQRQRQGFFAFLSDYESLTESDQKEFDLISQCVEVNDLKKTDFSRYVSCKMR